MKSAEMQNIYFETEVFTMTKKILAAVLAASVMLPCGARAEIIDRFEGHWELDTTRTVIFASDGGTYIRPVEKEIGTAICLDEYIPVKGGYIFDGWYSDPRTKENRITEFTFTENDAVYAKWIPNGTEQIAEQEIKTSPLTTAEILAYGNHIDEKTGVPVTALWVAQNNRLNELMEIYNENFK